MYANPTIADTVMPRPAPALDRRFLGGHYRTISLCALGTLLQSVLLLPIPLLQAWVIDRLLMLAKRQAAPAAMEAEAVRAILLALAGTIACLALRTAFAWKGSAAMSRVSLEVVRTLTTVLHRKFQQLPLAYFDRAQTGRLMARITSDVGTLLIFLNSASIQLICDLVLAAGIAGTLVWIDWRLALVSFSILPLYLVNYRWFAARTHRYCVRIQNQEAALYAVLSEKLSAVRVVRSFTNENAELADLGVRLDDYRGISWDKLRAGARQGALATLISGLGTLIALALGVGLVGAGSLGIGSLFAFYALLTQLYTPMVRLTQFQGTMAATKVALDRIQEVLAEEELSTEAPDSLLLARSRGALTLDGVSFAYQPSGTRVLDNIRLDFEPGAKVGILGPSGAGKSTLLALLPRIYELPENNGRILLDGQDVRSLRLADLRQSVVLVPQQALLFEGTIMSNILYARPKAPASLVDRVLAVTDLADLVTDLPQGLETPVGERGYSLSGGQRQRVALARALLTQPAVLLLDDCTSALDAETEARILAALEDFLPETTCLLVTHKVSSVRTADRIVVIDNGKVVEQGTPAQLLVADGAYARLVRMHADSIGPIESLP